MLSNYFKKRLIACRDYVFYSLKAYHELQIRTQTNDVLDWEYTRLKPISNQKQETIVLHIQTQINQKLYS
jgi:hypothetical protein